MPAPAEAVILPVESTETLPEPVVSASMPTVAALIVAAESIFTLSALPALRISASMPSPLSEVMLLVAPGVNTTPSAPPASEPRP